MRVTAKTTHVTIKVCSIIAIQWNTHFLLEQDASGCLDFEFSSSCCGQFEWYQRGTRKMVTRFSRSSKTAWRSKATRSALKALARFVHSISSYWLQDWSLVEAFGERERAQTPQSRNFHRPIAKYDPCKMALKASKSIQRRETVIRLKGWAQGYWFCTKDGEGKNQGWWVRQHIVQL